MQMKDSGNLENPFTPQTVRTGSGDDVLPVDALIGKWHRLFRLPRAVVNGMGNGKADVWDPGISQFQLVVRLINTKTVGAIEDKITGQTFILRNGLAQKGRICPPVSW